MNLRQFAKRLVKTFFLILTFPIYALMLLVGIVGDTDGAFQSFSQFVSLIPGKIGIYVRASFYRLACPNTSDEISIGFLTVFSHRDTTIEHGVYIGPQGNIGKCTIKKATLLGSGVHILSGKNQHKFDSLDTPIQQQGGVYTKVVIGEDCWLGNGSIVMGSLANQTIIAAGSVVTQDVTESATIYGGNPAKLLKHRVTQTTES